MKYNLQQLYDALDKDGDFKQTKSFDEFKTKMNQQGYANMIRNLVAKSGGNVGNSAWEWRRHLGVGEFAAKPKATATKSTGASTAKPMTKGQQLVAMASKINTDYQSPETKQVFDNWNVLQKKDSELTPAERVRATNMRQRMQQAQQQATKQQQAKSNPITRSQVSTNPMREVNRNLAKQAAKSAQAYSSQTNKNKMYDIEDSNYDAAYKNSPRSQDFNALMQNLSTQEAQQARVKQQHNDDAMEQARQNVEGSQRFGNDMFGLVDAAIEKGNQQANLYTAQKMNELNGGVISPEYYEQAQSDILKEADKYTDTDKIQDMVFKNLEGVLNNYFSNKNALRNIAESADRLNMGKEQYVNDYVMKQISNYAQRAIEQRQLERVIPKNAVQAFANRIGSSVLGKLVMPDAMSADHKQRLQQGMAISDGLQEFEQIAEHGKSYYKTGIGDRAAGFALTSGIDYPIFGALGKGADLATRGVENIIKSGLVRAGVAKASQKLTAQQMAFKLANMTTAQKIKANLGHSVLSSTLNLTGYGALSGMADYMYSTGDDTSLAKYGKGLLSSVVEGGKSSIATGAALGLTGAVTHGLGSRIGITGAETTKLQKLKHGTQKLGYSMFSLGTETGAMLVGSKLGGEDVDLSNPETWFDQAVELLAFKAGDPKYFNNIKGVLHGLTHSTDQHIAVGQDRKGNMRWNDIRLNNDERNELMNSVSGKDFLDAFNKVSDGANANVKDSKKDFNTKKAYLDFMRDPNVSQITKDKVNAALGRFTTTHERSYRSVNDTQNKQVLEYSEKGTLLSRTSYKNDKERLDIEYRQMLGRREMELLSLIGQARLQDLNPFIIEGNNVSLTDDAKTFLVTLGYKPEEGLGSANNLALLRDMQQEGTKTNEAWQTYMEDKGVLGGLLNGGNANIRKILSKDPLHRSNEEEFYIKSFKNQLDAKLYIQGKLHPEQSKRRGMELATESGLGTDKPKGEAVTQTLDALTLSENGVDEWYNNLPDGSDIKVAFDNYRQQGLSLTEIYNRLRSLASEEDLAPLADAANAIEAKNGVYEQTVHTMEETAKAKAANNSYSSGTMNGEAQNGDNIVIIQDSTGRQLYLVNGDVAFDEQTHKAKEGVGDMLICKDENGNDVTLSVSDATLVSVGKTQDYMNNELLKLQQVNSVPYNEAMQKQAAQQTQQPQSQQESTTTESTQQGTTPNADDGSMKFSDGTPVPMLEDGNPDFQKMTPEQGAEVYATTFGNKAKGLIDKQVKTATDKLAKLENQQPTGKDFKAQMESAKKIEAEKKKIQNELLKYQSIQAVMEQQAAVEAAKAEAAQKAAVRDAQAKAEAKKDADAIMEGILNQSPSENGKTTGTTTTSMEGDTALSQSEGEGKGTENNSSVQENPELYKVANSLQGKVGQSLSEEEADGLVAEMENRAEPARELELTPENWTAEFGEDGKVSTPLGEVKMGENQLAKLFMKGRDAELGMIKPTLTSPDVIIEEESKAADGNEERPSSYLFVKTFIRDGKKVKFFTSVTVKKDGMEVSVSSHIKSKNAIDKKMQEGKILYIKGVSTSNSSDRHLAEHPNGVPDLLPTQENDTPSVGKDTNNSSNGNGNNTTLTFEDGNPIPVDAKGEPDFMKMTAQDGAKVYKEFFEEDAQKQLDSDIKKMEADLKKVQKMQYQGKTMREKAESRKKIQSAIALAKAQLDKAKAIKAVLEDAKNPNDGSIIDGNTDAKGRNEQERKQGYRIREGNARYDRQKPEEVGGVRGKEVEVAFSPTEKVKGHVKLVELNTVQGSHVNGHLNMMHFGHDWQPKNRGSEASMVEAAKIAGNIDPKQITGSDNAFIGSAPSVNERHETIQGNNRVEALKQMYSSNPEQAAKYKQYLMDHAAEFGLNAEDIQKMDKPVLVNELPVDDAKAKELGQMMASGFESGGSRIPEVSATINKLGDNMENLANVLLAQGNLGEDARLSELISQNSMRALEYLNKNGFIDNTQMENLAKDSQQRSQWLEKVLKTSLFDGDRNTEAAFSTLPSNAQKAVLATFMRDIKSKEADRIKPNIQKSFEAFNELNQIQGFKEAKNLEQARAAVKAEVLNGSNSMYEEAPLREKYTNFELELAARYKGYSDQKTLTRLFGKFFDAVQGKGGDLFNQGSAEPMSKDEAIKEVFETNNNLANDRRRESESPSSSGRGDAVGRQPRGKSKGVKPKKFSSDPMEGIQNAANGYYAEKAARESKKRIIPEDVDKAVSDGIEKKFDDEVERVYGRELTPEEKNEVERIANVYRYTPLNDEYSTDDDGNRKYHGGLETAIKTWEERATEFENYYGITRETKLTTNETRQSGRLDGVPGVSSESQGERSTGGRDRDGYGRIPKEDVKDYQGIITNLAAAKRALAYHQERARVLSEQYGVEHDEWLQPETIERIFKDFNSDKNLQEIYDRIKDQVNNLGIYFGETYGGERNVDGFYRHSLNDIRISIDRLVSFGRTRQELASTILHEMLHPMTSDIIGMYQKGHTDKLTEGQIEAAKEAVDLFNELKQMQEDGKIGNHYALTNAREMITELASPEWRNALAKIPEAKHWWQKFVNSVAKMLGFDPKYNKLGQLTHTLDNILSNFGKEQFDYATKHANELFSKEQNKKDDREKSDWEKETERLFDSLKDKRNTRKEYNDTVTELARKLAGGRESLPEEATGGMEGAEKSVSSRHSDRGQTSVGRNNVGINLRPKSVAHCAADIIAHDVIRSFSDERLSKTRAGLELGQKGPLEASADDTTSEIPSRRVAYKGLASVGERDVSSRIESWAKQNNAWFDWRTLRGRFDRTKQLGSGDEAESDVFLSKDGKTVLKIVRNPHAIYDTLKDKLDSIALHNELFPNDAMNVIGFTKIFEDGISTTSVLLEQPFAEGKTVYDSFGTSEEREKFIDELMGKLGFTKEEWESTDGFFRGMAYDIWRRGDFAVEDVNYNNVIIDKNNVPHIIDCVALKYKDAIKNQRVHDSTEEKDEIKAVKKADVVHLKKEIKNQQLRLKVLQDARNDNNKDKIDEYIADAKGKIADFEKQIREANGVDDRQAKIEIEVLKKEIEDKNKMLAIYAEQRKKGNKEFWDGRAKDVKAKIKELEQKIVDRGGDLHFRTADEAEMERKKEGVGKDIAETIEKVSKEVGTQTKQIYSADEVTDPRAKKAIEEGRHITGWFDPKTGEVHLYMPNIHDEYTAEKTIYHEVVGHKGMRGLFGDQFNRFMRSLWYDLDNPRYKDMKEYVMKNLAMNKFDIYDTIEEYLANAAEEGKGEPGFWNGIRNWFNDGVRSIGYRLGLGTKDLKYALWLAKNYQKHPENDGFFAMRKNALLDRLANQDVPDVIAHNGMFYNADGKKVTFKTMTKAEFNEATDARVHFRTTPSNAFQIQQYNRILGTKAYMFKESTLDNMQSLQEAMKLIAGVKEVKDIPSFENPYLAMNRLSSVVQQKGEAFNRAIIEPLNETVAKAVDSFDGKKLDDKILNFNKYLIKVHGLERNRVLYVRDAAEALDRKKATKGQGEQLMTAFNAEIKRLRDKLNNDKNYTLDKFYNDLDGFIRATVDPQFEAKNHDYSGFHGLQEIENDADPYDDAIIIKDVMNQEAAMGDKLRNELWGRINELTGFALNEDYITGFIDKPAHERIANMFSWYVPLRKFDEKTAEDVYGYITEKADPKTFIGSTIMKAKGRKSLSDVNVLAQAAAMAGNAISNGALNDAKKHLLRFVENHATGDRKDRLFVETNIWAEQTGIDNNGNPIYKEATPQIPLDATPDEMNKIVNDFETDMKAKEKNGLAHVIKGKGDIPYKFEREQNRSQHMIEMYVGGKRRVLVVQGNPRVAQAINGLLNNSKGDASWQKAGQVVTRWSAQFVTSYNPDFVKRNAERDFHFASANVLKEGYRYTKSFEGYYHSFLTGGNLPFGGKEQVNYWGLYSKFRNGKLNLTDRKNGVKGNKIHDYFNEFMMNGGQTGFNQIKTADDWRKEMSMDIKKLKGKNKVNQGFKKVFNAIDLTNEAVENIARFSAYCASRDAGRDIGRSIYDAKEVSTNFNRQGSGNKIGTLKTENMGATDVVARKLLGGFNGYMRNYTMFYNASVQGANLFMKNLKYNTAATLGGMMAMPFALGAAMPLVNQIMYNLSDEDKDPYAELPDFQRRNNICIYLGNNNWYTIPLPIELRAFYGLGDLAAGLTFKPELQSNNTYWDIVGQIAQIFPVSDFLGNRAPGDKWEDVLKDFGLTMTPQILKPVAETLPFVNRNWTGRPLYRNDKYVSDYDPQWQRAFGGTNQALIKFNQKVNMMFNGIDDTNPEIQSKYRILDVVTAPAVWQHIGEGYGGGVGSSTMRLVNLMFGSHDVGDIPVLRTMIYKPREGYTGQRTKSKYYNYHDEMDRMIDLKQRLGNKNTLPDQFLRNMDTLYKLENSMDMEKVNIINDADKEISSLKKELKRTDAPEEVADINQQIDWVMEEAVKQLDSISE